MPIASQQFPGSTAASLVTPEGRRWWVRYAKSEAEGMYLLELQPSDRSPDGPLEKLGFSVMDARMSKSRLEQSFAKTKAEFDPQLVYSVEGDEDDFVIFYHSPGYREHAIWRTVRKGPHYIGVSYRERVGTDAAAELAYWTRTITGLPDGFFGSALSGDATPLAPLATDPGVLLVRHLPSEGQKASMLMAGRSTFDERPQLRFHPNPDFRYAAHLKGMAARIVLDLEIRKDGSVANVSMVEATPPVAGEAAVAAFKQALFVPAKVTGQTVSSSIRLTYEFTL